MRIFCRFQFSSDRRENLFVRSVARERMKICELQASSLADKRWLERVYTQILPTKVRPQSNYGINEVWRLCEILQNN